MKRLRTSGTVSPDCIDRLPNDVLIKILDLLPAKNAVAMSVLSQRWRNLWKHMTNIDIRPDGFGQERDKIVDFICSVVKNHEAEKIKKFCVSVCYSTSILHHVSSWLSFAMKKDVEELSLDLNPENSSLKYGRFHIPQFLRGCLELTNVKLKFVELDYLSPPFPATLKQLLLERIVLPEDGVEKVTSHCRQLEKLFLVNCSRKSDLHVIIDPECNQLDLVIQEEVTMVKGNTKLHISASRINSIEFVSALPRRYYEVNVEVVVGVKFILDRMSYAREATKVTSMGLLGRHYSDNFRQLLNHFQIAEQLVLSSWCVQVLAVEFLFQPQVKTHQANHLMLESGLKHLEFEGICSILAACSHLKSLSIVLSMSPEYQELRYNDSYIRLHANLRVRLFEKAEDANSEVLKCSQNLAVLEFRNFSGEYQTWEDQEFDESKFFKGTDWGSPLLLDLKKNLFRNLNKIIYVTSKKRYEVNVDSSAEKSLDSWTALQDSKPWIDYFRSLPDEVKMSSVRFTEFLPSGPRTYYSYPRRLLDAEANELP
ncbi:hypothetical protein Droror1_Dr00015047 [Drosera rotundifolia]